MTIEAYKQKNYRFRTLGELMNAATTAASATSAQ